MIRSLEEEVGRPIGILVDLQGPKLRLGAFAERRRRTATRATSSPSTATPTPGDATRVYLPHPEILRSLAPGHRILIDDGKMLLRVADVAPGRASTVVEVAGRVSNKKGVSLPDTDNSDLRHDRQGSRRPRRGARGEHRLDRALVRAAARRTSSRSRRSPGAGRWSWPRSRSRRPSSASTRSSRSPTRSWSPAATSASKCRSSRCRACRSA